MNLKLLFRVGVLLSCFGGNSWTFAQNIGDFVSLQAGAQDQQLHLPATHTFQVLIQKNDAFSDGNTMPDLPDFTAYMPINGSSRVGHLCVNEERYFGGVHVLELSYDSLQRVWTHFNSEKMDMSLFCGARRNCSGGITPWLTVLSCEESYDTGDCNADGYQDFGWVIEVNPYTRELMDYDTDGLPDKLWRMGRFKHENAACNANGRSVYLGADDSSFGFVYKYVADSVGNLSSGNLFVLKQITSNTAEWVQLPNTTPQECNEVQSNAVALGASNYNGVEDVEIGPDGKIYFASKGFGKVFRFDDTDILSGGAPINNFETFVGGQSYLVNYGGAQMNVSWGLGNDNLAFDEAGNLWVLQDGGNNYIWVVGADHTQANPKVKIFARTPAGCEPTGITFSPDFQFLFMSIMHPSAANTMLQTDAADQSIIFNRDATIIIARKENLGCNDADNDGLCIWEDTDNDNDGLADVSDNCPYTPNSWQFDTNGNGQGDACDCFDAYVLAATDTLFANQAEFFSAKDSITAYSQVQAQATLSLDAATAITLKEGFVAEQASDVRVFIEGCAVP
ncbi:MAG: DUF839 domain-containing protein [Chitinophagales bacterium]|nr:DUF839 domain-containing protein [Bacteroidota bacterium]MCB9043729.1 DUF839 domain-containing protein [Chitinophagales bacterium]